MNATVQRCNHCGANLTLDDLRKPDCPYCRTVLPHHAQAAQHAQMAGQVMNQMMAQQAAVQQQWRAGFGVGPMPTGMPGGPPPGMGPPPMGAYGDPARMAGAQMDMAARMSRNIMIGIVVTVMGTLLLVVGVIVVIALMR